MLILIMFVKMTSQRMKIKEVSETAISYIVILKYMALVQFSSATISFCLFLKVQQIS
jgi:hypothetical protein